MNPIANYKQIFEFQLKETLNTKHKKSTCY